MNAVTTQSDAERVEAAESFLKELLGKRLTVKVSDGRKFVGVLICTDRDVNIIMRDVIEFPAGKENPTDDMCRKIALITIRGIHIQQILIDENLTAESGEYNVKRIVGVVTLYWVISISLVFINKWLLSSSDLLIDAPLFITWFQCITTVLLCVMLARISSSFPDKLSFPSLNFDWRTSVKIMPLSCIFFAMILFNNLCLKYLSVAFYFVARSLTTVFNVILTYLILKKKTSSKAIACCGIIISGYILSVLQENGFGTLSPIGLVCGLGASLAVSLFSIYTTNRLPYVEGSVWRLTFYNNLNSSLLFIIGIVVTGELSELQFLPSFFTFKSFFFWSMMLIGGVFGFAISYVTTWQIQVTSPLTHNISGTAKAAVQTILATLVTMDFKSPTWWLGNCMVVGGSVAYAYVRHQIASADCNTSSAESAVTRRRNSSNSGGGGGVGDSLLLERVVVDGFDKKDEAFKD